MSQFTIYRSGDSGAPVLTGETGKLIDVLDGCLINGYTASVTSITRVGSTATVTTATNHGLNTGNSTTIAGANETDYNGTFVVTVTGLNTFTYSVPGTPATPATGTITWKKLGVGWTKAFTGTSKAIYRLPSGTQMYLRVQDDGPGAGSFREARITGYENPTDIDATNPNANPFPTAAQGVGGIAMVVARKSAALSATARDWVIAADERTMYMFVYTGDQTDSYYAWMFGDIASFKLNDPYGVIIIGRNLENNATNNAECMGQLSNTIAQTAPAMFIARGHTEVVGSVAIGRHGDQGKCSIGDRRRMAGDIPYTNPEDGALYLSQVWVHDPTTIPALGLRGRMRGFYQMLHPTTSGANGDTFSGGASGEYTGKTFLLLKFAVNGNAIGSQDGMYVLETSNTLEN